MSITTQFLVLSMMMPSLAFVPSGFSVLIAYTLSPQPLTKETANPNAATAAASAFLRQASSSSLSSAAAAAALRARPTTPTIVADVQSKRTRRNPSISSTTSREGVKNQELQRTPSICSMIDRTFRSPSPGRSPAPQDYDIPPVPIIPVTQHNHKPYPARCGKDTVLQTQPFKTASQKVKAGQPGTWFSAAATGNPTNVRKTDSVLEASSPDARSGSISPSINFSYPLAPIVSTINPISPSTSDQELVYDANSRRMVPRAELVARSRGAGDELDKPPKKKRPSSSRNGSDATKAGLGQVKAAYSSIRQNGTALGLTAPIPMDHQQVETQLSEHDSSIVTSRSVLHIHPMVDIVTPSPIAAEAEEDVNSTLVASARQNPNQVHLLTTETSHIPAVSRRGIPEVTKTSHEIQARSAHFASASDQEMIKHEPPPRSLSPRKSALKLSSSTLRGNSPAPSHDGSEVSGLGSNSNVKDDASTPRKKMVRVSWDDRNSNTVGELSQGQENASSVLPEMQAKKPWHNIVAKYAKKDAMSLDADETMSPRPALPLFGSIREKKAKEPEERPLVRPHEQSFASQLVSASSISETNANTISTNAIQPSEPRCGDMMTQETGSKHEANISKYREPLPPIAAPAENDSDDGRLASDEELQANMFSQVGDPPLDTTLENRPLTDLPINPKLAGGPTPLLPVPQLTTKTIRGTGIGLQGPTATVGGDNPDRNTRNVAIPGRLVGGVMSLLSTQSGDQEETDSSSQMDDIQEVDEENDSDRCSIYSDAYEELSEIDGDGFMSLDAVLESPIETTAPKMREAHHSSNSKVVTLEHEPVSQVLTARLPQEQLEIPDDWENAKKYWRSLSSEKRRQLENEAMEADDAILLQTMKAYCASDTTHDSHVYNHSGCEHHPHAGTFQPLSRNVVSEDGSLQKRRCDSWRQVDNGSTGPKVIESPPPIITSVLSSPIRNTTDESSEKMEMTATSRISALSIRSGGNMTEHQSRQAAVESRLVGDGKNVLNQNEKQDIYPGRRMESLRQTRRPASSYQPSQNHGAALTMRPKRNHSADGLGTYSNVYALQGSNSRLKRRGSDSSESSFRRTRATNVTSHGFRKSMRRNLHEQSPSSPDGSRGNSRFSLRSLSPTGSTFRRNSVTSLPSPRPAVREGMRLSLRHRPTSSSTPRSRMSGFGRSVTKRKGKTGLNGSRFVDSSDDDEDHPVFQSRFVDSSEDEESVFKTSQSGRSHKAKHQEGLSNKVNITTKNDRTPALATHFPDDTEDGHGNVRDGDGASLGLKSTTMPSIPQRNRSGRGAIMHSGAVADRTLSDHEDSSPRGNFMSVLWRKRNPAGKITRDVSESAARRDTKLERSTDQLNIIRGNDFYKMESGWPFPDGKSAADKDGLTDNVEVSLPHQSTCANRPSTASGLARNELVRLGFNKRRSVSHQGITVLYGDENQNAPGIQLRKKKFSVLRRIFKLDN